MKLAYLAFLELLAPFQSIPKSSCEKAFVFIVHAKVFLAFLLPRLMTIIFIALLECMAHLLYLLQFRIAYKSKYY